MLNVKPIFKSCWSNNYPAGFGVGKYWRDVKTFHLHRTRHLLQKIKFLYQKNLMNSQPVFNLELTSYSLVYLSLYRSLSIWDPIFPNHRLGTPWIAVKSLFFKRAIDFELISSRNRWKCTGDNTISNMSDVLFSVWSSFFSSSCVCCHERFPLSFHIVVLAHQECPRILRENRLQKILQLNSVFCIWKLRYL